VTGPSSCNLKEKERRKKGRRKGDIRADRKLYERRKEGKLIKIK
jgi:hypothetical protein